MSKHFTIRDGQDGRIRAIISYSILADIHLELGACVSSVINGDAYIAKETALICATKDSSVIFINDGDKISYEELELPKMVNNLLSEMNL